MSATNSPYDLLCHCLNDDQNLEWAMATVVSKEGSSYRSPGAFMLINSLGQSFGLVSGGCLESDVVRRAQKVFQTGQAEYVIYDMLEEDSFAAELGIGCKGKIGLLIQAVTSRVGQVLACLRDRMSTGLSSWLLHAYQDQTARQSRVDLALYDSSGNRLACSSEELCITIPDGAFAVTHLNYSSNQWRCSLSPVRPPVNLWVFGGGADAVPLTEMAAKLGWRVMLVDHRPAYARQRLFPSAESIFRVQPEDFSSLDNNRPRIDAAVLMTHNLKLDAAWLDIIYQKGPPKYVGLLGPTDRKNRIYELTKRCDRKWFDSSVSGPVGLKIGGELPESIALSILAECHQTLHS